MCYDICHMLQILFIQPDSSSSRGNTRIAKLGSSFPKEEKKEHHLHLKYIDMNI